MPKIIKFGFIILGLFPITACDSIQKISKSAEIIDTQQITINELKSEVNTLKEEIDDVKQKQGKLELANFIKDFEKIAFLNPGDDGYSPIKFDLGTLTIQLSDVKAYANGSKVNLKFGNPLSSSINGLKTTVQWGQVDEKGIAINETAKSKEFTFTTTLRPGAWTTIPVVLEGVPPEKLGFVRVRDVTHTGIELGR
ncbi:DUF3251 domain-containing protein [Aeromonas salmonicida]|uniref:DUF3251 domain-containing protein n=1 Tax=Aeromonas salmonicida TaxID=645 RepID=A0AAX3VN62_AERSA|nr:DUF3251 domain-containing protein [Aeromonas salmonicida]WHF35346.1 DUF3251 domain-containing protein [Aeromonas salmonicida]